MSQRILMKTTQYGLSPRAGGWDKPGDDDTDAWLGDVGNKINLSTCAPTASARAALGIPPKAIVLLKITYPDARLVLYRETGDEAPEDDQRVDLFMPWAFDSKLPDFGYVEVVQ